MLTTWAARGVLGVSKEMADELVRQIDEHDIRPVIAKVYEFEDALDAFEALSSLTAIGKIVVKV